MCVIRPAPTQKKEDEGSSSANPFASLGGSFLVTPSLVVPKPWSAISESNNSLNATNILPTVSQTSNPNNEYTAKMQKLNKAFFTWMERQIVEHPYAVWKEGVEVTKSQNY